MVNIGGNKNDTIWYKVFAWNWFDSSSGRSLRCNSILLRAKKEV